MSVAANWAPDYGDHGNRWCHRCCLEDSATCVACIDETIPIFWPSGGGSMEITEIGEQECVVGDPGACCSSCDCPQWSDYPVGCWCGEEPEGSCMNGCCWLCEGMGVPDCWRVVCHEGNPGQGLPCETESSIHYCGGCMPNPLCPSDCASTVYHDPDVENCGGWESCYDCVYDPCP